MYVEIHPYFHDAIKERQHLFDENKLPRSEFYAPGKPQTIRLDIIRRIIEEHVEDGSIALSRLQITDSYQDDILVTTSEAETINKKLLSSWGKNELTDEVRALTAAIRDLWNLLRARLH